HEATLCQGRLSGGRVDGGEGRRGGGHAARRASVERHALCRGIRRYNRRARNPYEDIASRRKPESTLQPLETRINGSRLAPGRVIFKGSRFARRYGTPSCLARAMTLSATAIASLRPASMSLR